MVQPDGLPERIRQKILSGELPKAHCRLTWYGFGTRQMCVACEQRIAPIEIEVECDLLEGRSIRLHGSCYDTWSKEWPSYA